MTVIEALKEVEIVEDKALPLINRVAANADFVLNALSAVRQANLGATTNAVLDELLLVVTKAKAIFGR